MLNVLRLVGLFNAAIWLGGCVFFTLAAAPAVFQPEMKRLFQDYYTGVVAQFLQERYFSFQLVCGAVALAHTLADWFVRRGQRSLLVPGLLVVLYAFTLAGAFWFAPHLEALHRIKYTDPVASKREEAAAAFRAWHGLAQGWNLVMLGGLAFYFLRVATLPAPGFAGTGRPFHSALPHLNLD